MDPTTLNAAVGGLPLVDVNDIPVTLDLTGPVETLVFFIPVDAVDSSHALSAEAQAVIFEANAVAQASAAAGHPLNIVVIPMFGENFGVGASAAMAQQIDDALSPGVSVLRLGSAELFDGDGNATPAGAAAFTFFNAYTDATGVDFANSATAVLHYAPAAGTLDAITFAQGFNLGGALADDRYVVLEAPLEAALAATGPAVDLPADANVPPGLATTVLGSYDEIGEFMPNLTFTDADGQSLSLLDQTDGLLVLSFCTEWCPPCIQYSSSLNDVAALSGAGFAFVEMLLENVDTGLARTIDAEEWRDRFDLNEAVVTTNGDRVAYQNVIRGAAIAAFPTYIVIDGVTGEIVDRFTGFFGTEDLADHLNEVADSYYGALPGETIIGTGKADHLVGTNRSDTIIGKQNNDTIDAGAGNDRLDGGSGFNTLIGGRGNDTYVIADGRLDHNTIIEAGGASGGVDTIEITRGGRVDIGDVLPENVERLSITGSARSVDFVASGDGASINFSFGLTADTLSRIDSIRGTGKGDVITVSLGVDDPGASLGASHHRHDITVAGGNGADIIQVFTRGIVYVVNGNGGDDVITLISQEGESGTKVNGGDGNDVMAGSDGNDQLNGGDGNDAIDGGNGNDELSGGDGNDTIAGGLGDDILTGGDGTDRLDGGAGNDIYIVTDTRDSIAEHSASTAVSITIDEILAIFDFYGIVVDDFVANAGNVPESQHAGAPNPDDGYFSGQQWAEIAPFVWGLVTGEIPSEPGPDGEFIIGGTEVDGGIDLVQSSVSFDLGTAAGIENLTLTGSRDIDGFGNELSNTIIGNSGNNHLTGGVGSDFIDGRGGADRMEGGTEDDTYVVNTSKDKVIELAGEGIDTIQSRVSYTLSVNVENLVLIDNASDGTGNSGGNSMTGNDRANTLSGLNGDDVVDGGAGNDTIDGGNDNDTLLGGDGNDTLLGGAGDDILIGGANNDSMNGGAGADQFVFLGLDGKDTITGFEVARDIIVIEDDSFASLADLMAHAHQVGKDAVFTFDNGDSLTLKGINVHSITAQNFGDLFV
jgi:Ca2+-binding RTX toxin-like protein